MILDARLSELIKAVYAAHRDPALWDELLVDLLKLIGSCGGVATLIDLRSLSVRACRAYGPRHADLAAWMMQHPAPTTLDPLLEWASAHPEAGCCDSRAIIPEAGDSSHPFAQWATKAFNSGYWYLAYTFPTGGLTFAFAAHFSGQDLKSNAELEPFRIVFDHIGSALRIQRRPFTTDSARALLRLEVDGRVVRTSRGAEGVLAQQARMSLTDGSLQLSDPVEQKTLRNALDRAWGKSGFPPNPTAVHIRQRDGRNWIMVVRPVCENYGPFGEVQQQVELEIIHRSPVIGRLELVQSLFELTARELQVLRLLVHGHSIDSLSQTIEVSRNTTRSHLRAIFAKTRTASQSELMQLCGAMTQVADDQPMELAS